MKAKDLFKEMKRRDLNEEELRQAFPCMFAKLVPVGLVEYNEYNPNAVPPKEMRLLKHSIEEDGYTQPVVTIYDEGKQKYVVVDGAHRYKNAIKLGLPMIPVVVLNKSVKDRMASTIRHNRARGEHNVTQMSNIVAELVMLGWEDAEIGKHLGMGADEVLRLKQNTGIAEIFKTHEYSRAWE